MGSILYAGRPSISGVDLLYEDKKIDESETWPSWIPFTSPKTGPCNRVLVVDECVYNG